jgi:hypothetical protein
MQADATQKPGACCIQDPFPGVSQQFFTTAVPEADFPVPVNAKYGIRALFEYLVYAIHHYGLPLFALSGTHFRFFLLDPANDLL